MMDSSNGPCNCGIGCTGVLLCLLTLGVARPPDSLSTGVAVLRPERAMFKANHCAVSSRLVTQRLSETARSSKPNAPMCDAFFSGQPLARSWLSYAQFDGITHDSELSEVTTRARRTCRRPSKQENPRQGQCPALDAEFWRSHEDIRISQLRLLKKHGSVANKQDRT